jgi:hypothetical protein
MVGRPEPRRRRGRRGLAATSPAEARKEVLGEVGAGLGFRRGRALRVPARSSSGSGEVNDRKNRTEEEEERKKKKIAGKKKKGKRVGRPTSLVSAGGASPCAAKGGIQEDPEDAAASGGGALPWIRFKGGVRRGSSYRPQSLLLCWAVRSAIGLYASMNLLLDCRNAAQRGTQTMVDRLQDSFFLTLLYVFLRQLVSAYRMDSRSQGGNST